MIVPIRVRCKIAKAGPNLDNHRGSRVEKRQSYLKQGSHRQRNEDKVVTANIHARTLGMKLGAFLSALGITGGCFVTAVG
jgi:hypothetical protein